MLDAGICNRREVLREIGLAEIGITCYNPRQLIVVFNDPTMVCNFGLFAVSGKMLPFWAYGQRLTLMGLGWT